MERPHVGNRHREQVDLERLVLRVNGQREGARHRSRSRHLVRCSQVLATGLN